jgi:hypothetical protein
MRRESIRAWRKFVGKTCGIQARRHTDLRSRGRVPIVSVPENSKKLHHNRKLCSTRIEREQRR